MREQGGSASSQVVMVTPVVLLLVTVVFQLALVQHASHVVTAAAQHGAARGQVERGSTAAARRSAEGFLAGRGSRLLRDARVSASRTAETTRVEVRARVVSLVPWLDPVVTGAAEGPSERFRSRSER